MSKKIKTIQWNIGGGKAKATESTTHLISEYNVDYLEQIISFLKRENPDVITLQEVHSNDKSNQVKTIAEALGYQYYVCDFSADSHIEEGQRLGQAIISKFQLSGHEYRQFFNPKFQVVWEDGTTATTHDKGITKTSFKINNTPVVIKTLHAIPFRRFKIDIDSLAAAPIISDMQEHILDSNDLVIVLGDFNINGPSILDVMPELLRQGFMEVSIDEPTTPKGYTIDRALYKGLKCIKTRVVSTVKTDHYPVVTEFEL